MEMVTVWMAAVTTTATTKSFSNDFKSRSDAHTFFRCKRLTSKEKSAKVCKACHSSEKKTTKHTHTQKGMLKANDANLPWSHDQQ